MMAAHLDRPLVDGENEYITITRIYPVIRKRGHMLPEYWIAEGVFDGKMMRLIIPHIDRQLFVEAGYVAAAILRNVETTVSIDVLTTWKDNQFRVGEVVSRDESTIVHTEVERQAAWQADVLAYGKPTMMGDECQFSTSARWVTWSKNDAGQYVRLTATTRDIYAAKVQS